MWFVIDAFNRLIVSNFSVLGSRNRCAIDCFGNDAKRHKQGACGDVEDHYCKDPD